MRKLSFFLLSTIFIIWFVINLTVGQLFAVSCGGNGSYDLDTGEFINCEYIFGEEQEHEDPEDTESDLTPIVITEYQDDNGKIFIDNRSNINAYNVSFLRDEEISLADNTKLNLSLHENQGNLIFILGAPSGVINATNDTTLSLKTDPTDAEYTVDITIRGKRHEVKTDGNVRNITFESDDSFISFEYLDGDGDQEFFYPEGTANQNKTIEINNINDTNSNLEVNSSNNEIIIGDSYFTLDIKGFTYVDTLAGDGKFIINGEGKDNSSNFIHTFDANEIEINYATDIAEVTSSYSPIITVNAPTTIGEITNNVDSIFVNDELQLASFQNINNLNISAKKTVEINTDDDKTSNTVTNINGLDATLWIHDVKNSYYFNAKNVELDNLIIDNGIFIINNSVIDDESTTNQRVIHNVTSSQGSSNATLILEGEVLINNISHLDTLSICTNSSTCDNQAVVTLLNVDHLNTFEMGSGIVYIDVTNDQDGIVADEFNLLGGEINSLVLNTSSINFLGTARYNVLNSPNIINYSETINYTTDLPPWYEYKYSMSADNKNVYLEVARIAQYYSSLPEDTEEDVKIFAQYIDQIISDDIALSKTNRVLTDLDYSSSSGGESLALHINDLQPVQTIDQAYNSVNIAHKLLNIARLNTMHNLDSYDSMPSAQLQKSFVPSSTLWLNTIVVGGDYHFVDDQISNYNMYYLEGGWMFSNYLKLEDDTMHYQEYSLIYGVGAGNIDSMLYNIDDVSFNIGLILADRYNNTMLSTTILYVNNLEDLQRYYFSDSTYEVANLREITGRLSVNNIMVNVDVAQDFYLQDIRIKPRAFATNYFIFNTPYNEHGDAGMRVEQNIADFIDFGASISFSKDIAIDVDDILSVNLEFISFYRYGIAGKMQYGFTEVPIDYDPTFSNATMHEFTNNMAIYVDYKTADMMVFSTGIQLDASQYLHDKMFFFNLGFSF